MPFNFRDALMDTASRLLGWRGEPQQHYSDLGPWAQHNMSMDMQMNTMRGLGRLPQGPEEFARRRDAIAQDEGGYDLQRARDLLMRHLYLMKQIAPYQPEYDPALDELDAAGGETWQAKSPDDSRRW